MSRTIAPGAVDQSTVIRIVDSTDGTPETAVNEGSAGLALWYRREGGLKVTITPAALAALDSAHADGGIEGIGDGYYRLDLPDAAVAVGVSGVAVGGTVTGMVIIGAYHQLETPQTGDSFARLGAPAGASVSADVATRMATFTLPTNFAALSITAGGLVDIVQAAADKVWASATRTLTALGASLVQEIWDRATSALTTAGSIGKLLVDNVNAALSAIKAKTDSLTFTTANKVDAKLTSDGLDLVAAPADVTTDADMRSSFVKMFRGLVNRFFDNVTQDGTDQKVRNDAGTVVSTMPVSDVGGVQTKGKSA